MIFGRYVGLSGGLPFHVVIVGRSDGRYVLRFAFSRIRWSASSAGPESMVDRVAG